MGEYGFGAFLFLLVGWVAREIISYFKQKALRDEKARIDALVKSMKELRDDFEKHDEDHKATNTQVKELHEWHDKSDQDGVKVWYVRQSFEAAVQELGKAVSLLATNAATQTAILKDISENQKEIHKELAQSRERLSIMGTPRD